MNTINFRKKPVVIEAIRYKMLGDIEKMREAWGDAFEKVNGQVDNFSYELTIKTLEGDMIAKPGDYIIKGVKGEFYPCKPDIFEMTYEAEKAPQKLENHKYEVFGFINEQNVLMPEASRDRISLEGLPKGKLSRVMIQVVAET